MLTKMELRNLKKYSWINSDMVLQIGEDIEGKFYIRPIRWSGTYSSGKLKEGKCIARFDTREDAEYALINICGYSKGF
ncbi:hypothetical protein BK049_05155 [Bacillus xiamenensis]|uniref:Uncharacterized protein n=1 Tax=Bacillus xiamenensis TaxID=1178537 RepID=A0AAC9NAA8_9BACI|nr:hypothetical protein [Bacillus xiamenensis]AOZ88146.1 hypothetical protein BK049_05155 [Bacillus xiamenensis]